MLYNIAGVTFVVGVVRDVRISTNKKSAAGVVPMGQPARQRVNDNVIAYRGLPNSVSDRADIGFQRSSFHGKLKMRKMEAYP